MSNKEDYRKQQLNLDAEAYFYWLESHVDKQDHPRLLRDFFMTTNDAYSQCVALEFLYMYGYFDLVEQMIEKNKQSKNKVNRDWAYVFELIMAKLNRQVHLELLLEGAQRLNTEDPALSCINQVFIISIHFDMFEYEILGNKLDRLLIQIKTISDPIIAPLINQRLELVLFHNYWRRNEMILARKHGFNALAGTKNRYALANLHINLSLSYIFDEFESAIFHLNESKKNAESLNLTWIIDMIDNQNIPFLCAHFNRACDIKTPVKSEQAHLAIARGDLKLAQHLLSEVTEDTPFTKYYVGRAYQDRRILLQAYNEFIEKRSDHFFARLPLTALKAL